MDRDEERRPCQSSAKAMVNRRNEEYIADLKKTKEEEKTVIMERRTNKEAKIEDDHHVQEDKTKRKGAQSQLQA